MKAMIGLLAMAGFVALAACQEPAEAPPTGADVAADAHDGATAVDSGGAADGGVKDGASGPVDGAAGDGDGGQEDASAADADATIDGDAGGLPDAVSEDTVADAHDVTHLDVGDVEPDPADTHVADAEDSGDGDGGVDDGATSGPDVDGGGGPDADVVGANNPVGEPIPEIPSVDVPGFQGGLYGCDQPVEMPTPADVPGPCYTLVADPPGEPSISVGVLRYGYDCQMRPTFESWANGLQKEPYVVITQSYKAKGQLDEYSYDRTDILKASYVKKHHHDETGRLTEVVYSYPKGEDGVETAREKYSYNGAGQLVYKDIYVFKFEPLPPVESFGTSDHYTYSADGHLVQTDVYDSEGYLLSQKKQIWEGEKLVQVDEDWGINCSGNDWVQAGPVCKQDGVDGYPERRETYAYDDAGMMIRYERYWVYPMNYLYPIGAEDFEYNTDGKRVAWLWYVDADAADAGNFFHAIVYDYDEYGRRLHEAWWKDDPEGWYFIDRNFYDCWSK